MRFLITLFILLYSLPNLAQDSTLVLSYDMFEEGGIALATKDNWLFKEGKDSTYTQTNAKAWVKLKPSEIQADLADENGKFEGWFRTKIKLDETFKDSLAGLNFSHFSWTPMDLYINGNLFKSYGQTGLNDANFKPYNYKKKNYNFLNLQTDKTYDILLFVSDRTDFLGGDLKANRYSLDNFIELGNSQIVLRDSDDAYLIFLSTLLGVLSFLFWALYFQNKREKQLLFPTVTLTLFFVTILMTTLIDQLTLISYTIESTLFISLNLCFTAFLYSIPLTLAIIFKNNIPKVIWIASGVFFTLITIFRIFDLDKVIFLNYAGICYLVIVLVYYLFTSWKKLQGPKRAFVIGIGISVLLLLVVVSLFNFIGESASDIVNIIVPLLVLSLPISLLVYILLWLKASQKEKEKNVSDLIQITQEKKELLENQNTILEQQVTQRTTELNESLDNLKATQSQLIQSEKMASLGELTAGIAHEIQNPLNFVNNFSEVSNELIDEMNEEIDKGDIEEAKHISKDIKQNLEKINHHGKRADAIVKGMLQHSRKSTAIKEPTDINKLADEYLRLAYHGLRAKDKSFNATLETYFDENIGLMNVIPQDMGRVILNLITNAFYAVDDKKTAFAKAEKEENIENNSYEPTVAVSTKKEGNNIIISVKDNGNGMPKEVVEKIFQPFFTTKPTGKGTGLGLSMSYDIVTKGHGGELIVETLEGEGTTFSINLPK